MLYDNVPLLLWKSGEQFGLKKVKEAVAKSGVFS